METCGHPGPHVYARGKMVCHGCLAGGQANRREEHDPLNCPCGGCSNRRLFRSRGVGGPPSDIKRKYTPEELEAMRALGVPVDDMPDEYKA